MNELTRKGCEQACLYLLSHCYEVEHNGKEKYTFTPSGFGEAEVFKLLIEEHFDNPSLKFEELKEGMWIWDDKNKAYALVDKWAETGSCLVDIYTIKISKNPSNEIVDTIYKNKFENERFYCREVSQGGQKND